MQPNHRIQLADATLHERAIPILHDTPTGRQILEAADLHPVDSHTLFAILPNGDFEDLRLSEVFDLRAPRTERFIVFRTDRVYKFILNHRQISWGERRISGRLILTLARNDDEEVVLQRTDHPDRIIAPDDLVDLDRDGVEHLITRPRVVTVIANGRRKTVTARELSFEQIVALTFENPPTGEGVQFTVQYTRGPEANPMGTLLEGQTVKIKNGMEFDVTSTNRS